MHAYVPDNLSVMDNVADDDGDQQQRRLMLINFGHAQWGFNNWSWSVKKQDLDFVDFANGKYSAGVVAFVCVTVKSFDIHRENIGYATCQATMKGSSIHQARKCAVTNALRETLLSFGGDVTNALMELLETNKLDNPTPSTNNERMPENNLNLANKLPELKNSPVNMVKNPRKEPVEVTNTASVPAAINTPAARNAAPPPPGPRPPRPAPTPAPASAPRPSNELVKPAVTGFEGLTEEEARAERKRRQRLAQEEFRQKQMMKQKPELEEKQELSKTCNSFDNLLMDIPTQDIVIEETGNTVNNEVGKRKSPAPENTSKRRGSVINKLNIVTD